MKILLLILAITVSGCTENFQRKIKNVQSDWLGGLNRECTVYSISGVVLKRYTGRYDIKISQDQVLFDRDGKRVIIQNASVICEEV